jgi:hypothetical protein
MSVVSGPSREAEAVHEPPRAPALVPPSGGASARVIGVDVARGLTLLGMIAVHIFGTLHRDDTPSKTHQVMAGHALATFVLLAGVSLTIITKRSRTGSLLPDAAALTTRALIITFIGLALNSALDPDIDVILPYYGLMFLLAIPLLRRSSPVLIGRDLDACRQHREFTSHLEGNSRGTMRAHHRAEFGVLLKGSQETSMIQGWWAESFHQAANVCECGLLQLMRLQQ